MTTTFKRRLILVALGAFLIGCGGDGDDPQPNKNSEMSKATEATTTCAIDCTGSSGGPPTDGCRFVDGKPACVYTCMSDDDCEKPFWGGCTAKSNDGTKICAPAPKEGG